MKKHIYTVQAFILLTILVMTGCSYNNIYEIDTAANGLAEKIVGIKDLYNDGAKNVNIVFIHGMGYHPQEKELDENGVTRLYQNRLANELGFMKINDDEKVWSKDLLLRQSSIVGGKLSWRKFDDGEGKTLNLFALSWDEITVKIQKSMFELDDEFYEKGGSKNREKDRAYLNKKLKRFINRSFADPAIYLGSFGKEIRYIVAQGIAEIDAVLMDNGYLKNPNNNQIVIISDSLGSSVTFDTIKETRSINKSNELYAYKSATQRFAGLSTLIYMNANQLPLIELGRIEGPASNANQKQWLDNYPCSDSSGTAGLLGFSEVRKSAINQLGFRPNESAQELQVVAFTDPNDALSYYLTKRFKEHCSGDKVKIVNVMLTNAEWNYLFILAHPGKAHASGFKDNDKAVEIVVHGVH